MRRKWDGFTASRSARASVNSLELGAVLVVDVGGGGRKVFWMSGVWWRRWRVLESCLDPRRMMRSSRCKEGVEAALHTVGWKRRVAGIARY